MTPAAAIRGLAPKIACDGSCPAFAVGSREDSHILPRCGHARRSFLDRDVGIGHDLLGKPLHTPHQVRGRLFPDHAREMGRLPDEGQRAFGVDDWGNGGAGLCGAVASGGERGEYPRCARDSRQCLPAGAAGADGGDRCPRRHREACVHAGAPVAGAADQRSPSTARWSRATSSTTPTARCARPPPSPPVAVASNDAPAQRTFAMAGNDHSLWDETSLIGKVFIAFGTLLTVASAARMFMA